MQQQEEQCQMVPVLSLVPSVRLARLSHLNRKYWHIICRAELTLPHGAHFIRITIFLVWYNGRYYISILVQLFCSLEAARSDLEYGQLMAIAQGDPQNVVDVSAVPRPIACSVFQLPECPRCFLGYSCHSHCHPVC